MKLESATTSWLSYGLWGLLACLMVSDVAAQDVELRKSRGPYYVGDPVQIQVAVVLEDEPDQIDCQYDGDIDEVQVTGPQRNISSMGSSITINGRTVQRAQVRYEFLFRILANSEGEVTVGPFRLDIDGREQVIKGTRFDFEALEADEGMTLEFELADDQIYVGQRVPLKIKWTFQGDKYARQLAAGRLVVRSAMFDQFEFEDKGGRATDTMVIETADRAFEIVAQKRDVETLNDGRVTLTAERTLLAKSPGDYQEVVGSCRTIRGSDWGRSFFDIVPRNRKPAVAVSKPISFRILPLPTEGRPVSFSGAVGSGYSIEASANRSVLRVGDPISLEVTIRGDGNLEDLSVPLKTGAGGLDESLFQLPEEIPPGSFTGNAKQFKIPIRVKSESVDQIPAIPFSWFNPESEVYETSYSKPIALQVLEAQIVSAADVVSSPSSALSASSDSVETEAQSSSREMSFLGANLAIETSPNRLLATNVWLNSAWTQWILYGAGILAIAIGFATRVMGSRDPALAARAGRWQSVRSELKQARQLAQGQDKTREAMELVAKVLRGLLPELNAQQRGRLEGIVSECENHLFSPSGVSQEQAVRICERAQQATQELVKEVA